MVHFRYLPLFARLCLLWICLLAGCTSAALPTPAALERPEAGTRIEPPRAVADFTLTSHTGAPFSLSDVRGQVVLLYFGYTFCPDICPTTLAELVRVKHHLGPLAEHLEVVFISVDGQRDTPEVLARYLPAFDPDFIGLTGTEREIRKIGVDYGLFFEVQEVEGTSADYLVDHSAGSYLIDQEGRLHTIYPYGTPAKVISTDIRNLLEEAGN
jgi:protein SCO1